MERCQIKGINGKRNQIKGINGKRLNKRDE